MANDPANGPPDGSAPAIPQADDAAPSKLPFGLAPVDAAGLLAIAVAVAATFGPQLVWMVGRWWNSEYYGHGFFVAPVAAYLIYRRREFLIELPTSRSLLGLALVVFGLLLHLAAALVDVNFVSGFALVVVLGGLVLWLWGNEVGLALLFPVGYLCFMVPVDRLLIDAFSSPLQLMAAKLAFVFGQVIGMPVEREGVNLLVPGYTFEVAVACSGLKSFITMIALAALFAYIVKAVLWRRLVLVASSIPVALLANAVRVVVIMLIAQSLGPKAAEGFLHGFSGVIVFAVGLGALYGLGKVLGCHNLRDDI